MSHRTQVAACDPRVKYPDTLEQMLAVLAGIRGEMQRVLSIPLLSAPLNVFAFAFAPLSSYPALALSFASVI
jgi:hypothetical protein